MENKCVICGKEIEYRDQVQVIERKDGTFYRYIYRYETRFQGLAKAHEDCSFTLERLPEEFLIKSSKEITLENATLNQLERFRPDLLNKTF